MVMNEGTKIISPNNLSTCVCNRVAFLAGQIVGARYCAGFCAEISLSIAGWV